MEGHDSNKLKEQNLALSNMVDEKEKSIQEKENSIKRY